VRVYAVGDIHGRADLLAGLHQRIRDHAQAHPGPRNVVVYLGDYCDRGLNSRDVIDILLNHPLPGFESIHLRGNHDQEFLDFLVRPEAGRRWLRHGGDATLYSYGVEVPPSRPSLDLLQAAQAELRQKVPLRHVRFLEGLRLHHQAGDYFFVHAGINPEKEWSMQTPEDYLWIREEFLDSNAKFDKVVIHGHSAGSRPEVRSNRIGVDTGACYTNVLTCVVLEGVNRSFLSTRSAPTR
jgi:serine/threonine protein phosphatase 1